MKKIIKMLLLILIGVGIAKIECKADNITNDLIKNYAEELEKYDTNRDGEYSEEELSKVDEIVLEYGNDITTAKGISVLKNLKYLYLIGGENPNLKEIEELKNLKKITLRFEKTKSARYYLDVKAKSTYINSDKELESISLENIKHIPYAEIKFPKLKKIKMRNSKFKKVDISGLGSILKTLKGFENIETLHTYTKKTISYSNLKGIKKLIIMGEGTRKISIKNCDKLESVKMTRMKKLKTLNISNNKKLKKINFIDVNGKYTLKNNKKLENIYLDSCKIKKLDCKQFKNLKKIYSTGGRIDKLDFSKCHKVKSIDIDACKLKDIKLHRKNKIKYFNVAYNKLKKIDVKYLSKSETINADYNRLSGVFYMPPKVADDVKISAAHNKITKVIFPKKIFVFSLGLDHNKIRNVYMNGSELHIYNLKHNPPMTIYDGIVKGGHPHRDKGTKLVNCKQR